jgi:hypothetical protein
MIPKEDEKKIEEFVGRLEQLKSLRAPYENPWNDATAYILPNRGDFTISKGKGFTRTERIFDGTAPWANEQLASGLAGFLTNPTQRWFKLRFSDPDIDKRRDARKYLEAVENIMYNDVFNLPGSNFAPQSHELYMDIGAFGTSVMMIEDKPGAPINFQTFHLGNCYIAEDGSGIVNTIYRMVTKTNRQLLAKYPDKFSTQQKNAMLKKPYEEGECLHVVEPNDLFIPNEAKSTSKKWISTLVYMEKEKAILEEGGFDDFPYVVPRWQKTAEEVYGRGPGGTAMPDVKMVNAMMKTIIRAGQKVTDPPLMVPDDGFMLPIRTTPAGLNFYRSGIQDRIEEFGNKGRIDIGLDLLQNRHEHIMRVFHIDVLRMKEGGPEMTATEVLQRQEEKMRNIAPMTGRMQSEYTSPMITRVYKIGAKRKMFPDLPLDLTGQAMKIEYSSPVARAQKVTQLQNVTRLLEVFIPLVNIKPDLADKFDADGYFDWAHELLDAPTAVAANKDAVKIIRDERKKAQEEAQQKEDMQALASGGLDVAKSQALLQGGGNGNNPPG